MRRRMPACNSCVIYLGRFVMRKMMIAAALATAAKIGIGGTAQASPPAATARGLTPPLTTGTALATS